MAKCRKVKSLYSRFSAERQKHAVPSKGTACFFLQISPIYEVFLLNPAHRGRLKAFAVQL